MGRAQRNPVGPPGERPDGGVRTATAVWNPNARRLRTSDRHHFAFLYRFYYTAGMTVVTTSEARAALSQIAARFDAGEVEPVVFGSHRRAQAVIVPFEVWEKLLEQAEDERDLQLARERFDSDTGTRFSSADVAAAAGLDRTHYPNAG